MPFQGFLDQQYENTQELKDGRVGGRGLGAFLWQQFVDEDKLNREKQKTINQQTARSKGENLSDLDVDSNASTLDVEGAVITKGRERKATEKEENRLEQLGLIEAGQATGQAQIAAGERTSNAQIAAGDRRASEQMEMTRLQMAQTDKARLADRIDAREARADDLMFRREQMERMDRKDERNRRKDSIAALTAGLASLGAAFAL